MNWEAIGAVGELIGAVTVIITLLYLAIQIRQNSQAVKNSAAQTLLSEANGSLRTASSDPATARAVILGQTLFEELSEEGRAQFVTWYFSWMRTIEQAYFQYVQGYIDEEMWEGQRAHLRQLIQAPAVKEWWSHRRCFFSQRFQNYMDELAAQGSDVPTPTEIVQEMS
jgi:hypothetical protein